MQALGTVLSIKRYRLAFDAPVGTPIVPCLDHEAMLHEAIDPHAAVYLREHSSDELHEIIVFPDRRLVVIDTVSTLGESSPAGCARVRAKLAEKFHGYRIRLVRPSWRRGDRRVATACRSQVTLRQVLLDDDLAGLTAGIDRLRTIGTLMEKESRMASWTVRTITGPLLAAAAFVSYRLLGVLAPRVGDTSVAQLRYGFIGLLGAAFLYWGLKAVQLTGMSNRVWKRAAEYALIVKERGAGGGR